MAGKAGRPRRMKEASKPWNIMFPLSLIQQIKGRAEEDGISPAALVRKAAKEYISPDHGSGYEVGVRNAVFFLKEEAVLPRYPSGKTLGDTLADRALAING